MTAPYVPPPTLGWKPLVICPTFSLGEDWITALDASAGGFVWPDGATVAAEVYRYQP
jgi:hypothetical protein